jgi:Tfp pilus assembly protein PilP
MKPVFVVVVLLLPWPALAQSATPDATAAAPVTIPLGSRVGFNDGGYDDGGRRDPFLGLIAPRRTASARPNDTRPRTGLAALALADIAVKGIVRSGDTMMAILEGPGRQSYVARLKDRLLDASVQSIDSTGVVFSEQVETGTPVQIRKSLRTAGEDVR